MMDEELKITLSEDDLYEEVEVREAVRPLIVFRVSQEWYGVDIDKVREVVKFDQITRLPSAPPHIAGILNLRGSILSVTDLKKIFGFEDEETASKPRLVVV